MGNISIVKLNNKYYIYTPDIKSDNIYDKLCKWWGEFNSFDDVFNEYKNKLNEYPSLYGDINILRKPKLIKLKNRINEQQFINRKFRRNN